MANKKSFTSASTMPVKLVIDTDFHEHVKNHNIKPIHIQINPTNKCPYSCSFCSCAKRDLKQSYDFKKFKTMMDEFEALGTRAVTITGGGDPLAYRQFSALLDYIVNEKKMEAAMVTNGFMFPQYKNDMNLNKLTWCRISVYDEYPFLPEKIEETVQRCPDVDWAFSYVVTAKYDYDNLRRCLEFANKYSDRFSHVRVVSDILNEEVDLGDVKEKLSQEMDTSLCVWQGRKNYGRGNKRCMISLMKPNIDPEGKFMPCCGVQYAVDDEVLDFDGRLSMGNAFEGDIGKIYEKQEYFDGSICNKCYYNDYNNVLNTLWDANSIVHKNFT